MELTIRGTAAETVDRGGARVRVLQCAVHLMSWYKDVVNCGPFNELS